MKPPLSASLTVLRAACSLGVVCVLAGCEDPGPVAAPDPSSSARVSAAVAPGPSLFTARPLAEAIGKLEQHIGGPVRALELQVHADHLLLQAQDPKQPGNVDEYELHDGTLLDPVPVKLHGPGKLDDNLFPLHEARLDAIPGLVDAALAELGIEKAKVTHVRIKRNLPLSDDVQVRVFVSGLRKDGYVDADKDGKIIATSE